MRQTTRIVRAIKIHNNITLHILDFDELRNSFVCISQWPDISSSNILLVYFISYQNIT